MESALPGASLAAGFRRRATPRNLRLATGLVLFAYVLIHLVNHALVNISMDVGEAALDWVRWFWHMPLPTGLLYGSLLCHLGLGLWSLYERPRFAWKASEAAQLTLGLAIPLLLIGHVAATRLAYTLFETSQGYASISTISGSCPRPTARCRRWRSWSPGDMAASGCSSGSG